MTPEIQEPIAKNSFLKGFFNFDQFITTRIVKVVYVVGIVLILLATVGACGFAAYSGLYQIYARSSIFPLFEHLIGPLFFMILAIIYYIAAGLIGILMLRLYCEFIMVIFKINENLQVVRDRN